MKLVSLKGPSPDSSFELDEQYVYRLGREPSGDQIEALSLDSKTVSRNHAELSYEDGSWRIRDLESFNGIRVNKQKIRDAYLSDGDVIDLGEYSFKVDLGDWPSEEDYDEAPAATDIQEAEPESSVETPKEKIGIKTWIDKARRVDTQVLAIGGIILLAIVLQAIIYGPIKSKVEVLLLESSMKNAKRAVEIVAEKNATALEREAYFLLRCDAQRRYEGVRDTRILNTRGEVVCPVGDDREVDALTENAMARGMPANIYCNPKAGIESFANCSLIHPIKVWREESSVSELIGFARIDFYPDSVSGAMAEISSIFWKVFFFGLVLCLSLLWFLRKRILSALRELTDQVHLLFTGTAQKVENLESFAAFDELIEEVNRLVTHLNQGANASEDGSGGEASFLQPLFQQVFLLEERAMMAVDADNHIISATAYLSEAIPVDENFETQHITEAITDTHLQGELMSFLNDLAQSPEVLDRALSLSDRVVQSRGLAIFRGQEHIASLIIFD